MPKPMTLAIMSNREANHLLQTLLFSWVWDGNGKGRDLVSSLDKSVEVRNSPLV